MRKFTAIQKKLKTWREARHLNSYDQIKGLRENLLEEYNELKEGRENYNVDEVVDALCDIMVFALNAVPDLKMKSTDVDYSILEIFYGLKISHDTEKMLTSMLYEDYLKVCEVYTVKDFSNIDENDVEKYKDFYNSLSNALKNLIITCINYLTHLGYCPFKALEETIKEISSRTGKWDEEKNKFIKDEKISPYTADYSKCLKDEDR